MHANLVDGYDDGVTTWRSRLCRRPYAKYSAMPITIQITSRSHVARGRLAINSRDTTAEAIGTSGTQGARKGRCSVG